MAPVQTSRNTIVVGLPPGPDRKRQRRRRRRTAWRVTGAVVACAAVGTILTDPENRWYKSLAKPSWQPPAPVFPIAWTALYADIAWVSTRAINDAREHGRPQEAKSYVRALGVNLVLNAAWCGLFFRGQRPVLSTVEAGALALSSLDLVRRAGRGRALRGWALAPYALWTGFATALSGELARLNPGK